MPQLIHLDLLKKKIPIGDKQQFPSVIIPFKNTLEIIRILDTISGNVHIHFDKNQISFSSDNIYITSRLIDGIFPDYKQIIPKEFTTEVTLLKQDMFDALKISNIFSDKLNQIDFHVNPKENVFSISSRNADIGENTTNLDAALSGEELKLSFNYRYLVVLFFVY